MILPAFRIPTQLEIRLNQCFQLYKDDILRLTKKHWKQEDLRGDSLVQYQVMQYYNAIYMVILIHLEVERGYTRTWQYYVDKYDLNGLRKCLACEGIDIDKILEIFELPFEEEDTPEEVVPDINLQALLENPDVCSVIISSNCPFTPCNPS